MSGPATPGEPLPGSLGSGGGAGRGPIGAHAQKHIPAEDRLARVVFALLVLGCFAAFVVTQHLKHTPTAVQEFKRANAFLPESAGRDKLEAISFKLAKAGEVTVTIENLAGDDVATLARGLPVARYKKISLRWSGREGAVRGYTFVTSAHGYRSLLAVNRGRPAPAGEYRARVTLRGEDRTYSSRNFTLVRK